MKLPSTRNHVAQTSGLRYRRVAPGSRPIRQSHPNPGNGLAPFSVSGLRHTASPRYSRPEAWAARSAFTMIEIAISLAIIAFALVAIIGILPAGMSVQKDNRQETIVNQDASLFLNAMRNGARGLDDLTNYVIGITNFVDTYNTTRPARPARHVYTYTYQDSRRDGALTPVQYPLRNGSIIIGLLTTPKIIATQGLFNSNHVVAAVRSISGPASEKPPQRDETIHGLGMNYKLIVEVSNGYEGGPGYVPALTNIYIPPPPPSGASSNVLAAYTNYLRYALTYSANVYDVRLTFRWPLLPNGETGPSRQAFRTIVSGPLANDPTNSPLYFFQPYTFIKGV
jgi:type II secretory pathway pseudopilin PulG